MINPVLEIIYRLLKKAIAADHMAELFRYAGQYSEEDFDKMIVTLEHDKF